MTLSDIRAKYNVPAYKGVTVKIELISTGIQIMGIIVGATKAGLKVKLSDGTIRLAHPLYGITYVEKE